MLNEILVTAAVGTALAFALVRKKNKKTQYPLGSLPENFSRILSDSIADKKSNAGVKLNACILFSDIRSFSAISSGLPAEETISMLGEYFSAMIPAIEANGGIADKFVGDGLMGIFPEEKSKASVQAAKAAVEMRKSLRLLNENREKNGSFSVRNGIGISSGELLMGVVRTGGRSESIAAGNCIKIASYLESLTKYYRVPIIADETCAAFLSTETSIRLRLIDRIAVKNDLSSENIYEIIEEEDRTVLALKLDTLNAFESAVHLYRKGNFEEAEKIFLEIHHAFQEDRPTRLYIKRCRQFAEQPPSPKWDGSLYMNTQTLIRK